MSIRLRPLWLLLVAIVWCALVLWFTPALDSMAEWIGDKSSTQPDDVGGALLWAVPWLLAGAVLFTSAMAWVYIQPAWHPWRDTIFAAVWCTGATIAPYFLVNRVDLWEMFGHFAHERVDLAGLDLYVLVSAMVGGTYAFVAIAVGLAAANRIWATPLPRREEAFGPRVRPQ